MSLFQETASCTPLPTNLRTPDAELPAHRRPSSSLFFSLFLLSSLLLLLILFLSFSLHHIVSVFFFPFDFFCLLLLQSSHIVYTRYIPHSRQIANEH